MKKNKTFWCVFDSNGELELGTIDTNREASQNAFCLGELFSKTWSQFYRLGYRCKKVKIIPVEERELRGSK